MVSSPLYPRLLCGWWVSSSVGWQIFSTQGRYHLVHPETYSIVLVSLITFLWILSFIITTSYMLQSHGLLYFQKKNHYIFFLDDCRIAEILEFTCLEFLQVFPPIIFLLFCVLLKLWVFCSFWILSFFHYLSEYAWLFSLKISYLWILFFHLSIIFSVQIFTPIHKYWKNSYLCNVSAASPVWTSVLLCISQSHT
jgi:hypothetical protein